MCAGVQQQMWEASSIGRTTQPNRLLSCLGSYSSCCTFKPRVLDSKGSDPDLELVFGMLALPTLSGLGLQSTGTEARQASQLQLMLSSIRSGLTPAPSQGYSERKTRNEHGTNQRL